MTNCERVERKCYECGAPTTGEFCTNENCEIGECFVPKPHPHYHYESMNECPHCDGDCKCYTWDAAHKLAEEEISSLDRERIAEWRKAKEEK